MASGPGAVRHIDGRARHLPDRALGTASNDERQWPPARCPGSGPGPRAGRWATYAVVVVCLAMVAALVAGVVVVRKSYPQTDGEITVPGLQGRRVDEHQVPQVYADSSHDLFYAQGFVQAQDRFYEMDVRRHITSGRLAEMLGEDALDADKFIRTMGWRRVAEEELSLLDPDTTAYLEAFSAGVNAYIDAHSPSEMSLEYSVLALNGLDYTVEEWTPADSVAWLKAMAWDLRGNMEDEIDRAILSGRHNEADIAELYPAVPLRPAQPDRGPGRCRRRCLRAGRRPVRYRASPPVRRTATRSSTRSRT